MSRETQSSLLSNDQAPLISALKVYDQAIEIRQLKREARQMAMKALHKMDVGAPLTLLTPEAKSALAPLAGFLIDWVTTFEQSGLRTAIWKRFGAIDLPIARETLMIESANGPGELVCELLIVVHGWVTHSGFYRYRETIGDQVAFSSDDKLEDADDLIAEIPQELLRQFRDFVASGKVWKNIENWVITQTEAALKDR